MRQSVLVALLTAILVFVLAMPAMAMDTLMDFELQAQERLAARSPEDGLVEMLCKDPKNLKDGKLTWNSLHNFDWSAYPSEQPPVTEASIEFDWIQVATSPFEVSTMIGDHYWTEHPTCDDNSQCLRGGNAGITALYFDFNGDLIDPSQYATTPLWKAQYVAHYNGHFRVFRLGILYSEDPDSNRAVRGCLMGSSVPGLTDLVLLAQALRDSLQLSEEQQLVADVNCDGRISIYDLVLVAHILDGSDLSGPGYA